MTKKIDIPLECMCVWEQRIIYLRSTNGSRTEDAQAELTKLEPQCPVHKGVNE